MDRDPVPLPAPAGVYRLGLFGAAACFAAAVLGLVLDPSEPGPLSRLRLWLVAGGLLAAGAALSQRPGLPLAWLIAAAACVAARIGLPPHWDSVRMVAVVAACVTVAAAGIAALPLKSRLPVVTLAIVYHFVGIFFATTWPDPTPWITQQVGTRTHLPYLMFMYMRNAYHFYSPEPGPASLLFALITYDLDEPDVDPKTGKPRLHPDGTAKKKTEAEWFTMPNRGEHLRDPLGLTYYRRLSLTEQVSQTIPEFVTPASFEKFDVRQRRMQVARGELPNYPRIPLAPEEVEQQILQYRMPQPQITRYLLPSYARHLMAANSTPGRTAVRVKMYRIEHRIIPVTAFVEGFSPHHPALHKAYFVGEFARNPETGKAELVDPTDPMLYWLVPILANTRPGDPPKKTIEEEIDDNLSKHAGFKFEWRRP